MPAVLFTRLLLIVILALRWDTPCFATTIVAIITRTHLFIGADSMLTLLNSKGERQVGSICKVHSVGSCYYAIAGIIAIKDKNIDFNEIAKSACLSPGSLTEKATFYQAKALPAAKRLFTYDKSIPLIRGKGIAVLFAALENGFPMFVSIEYNQDRERRIIPSRQEVRGSDLSGTYGGVIVLGTREAIDRYRMAAPKTFQAGDAAIKVAHLLNLEAVNDQAKPVNQRLVRAPFSILELSIWGARWIMNGHCSG
ncbi:MAG TPA: hypothetical protein VEX68_14785 [Bryobacteraceae bacterium]|nr:hypothetical protein [Bryobacteraceae bacterium]